MTRESKLRCPVCFREGLADLKADDPNARVVAVTEGFSIKNRTEVVFALGVRFRLLRETRCNRPRHRLVAPLLRDIGLGLASYRCNASSALATAHRLWAMIWKTDNDNRRALEHGDS